MTSFRKDVIPMEGSFGFNLFDYKESEFTQEAMHFHDCLELNMIEAGTGINRIEKTDYLLEPGDVYLINNLEHHMAINSGRLKMLVIVFNPDFIWQGTPENYDYLKPFFERNVRFSNKIAMSDACHPQIRDIIDKIRQEWQVKAVGYPLAIKALLMYLLSLLYRHYAATGDPGADVKRFHDAYDRLRPVVEYIHRHFHEPMSLDDLAGMAMMNKSYFSTYFKKVMGRTLTAYLESLRLQHACLMMRTTNRTLTEVAMDSGFGSTGYFDRSFKKIYGMTPNQYRQNPDRQ